MNPLTVAAVNYRKQIDEICGYAKKITSILFTDIAMNHKDWLEIGKKHEYGFIVVIFGNEIVVEVEVPLCKDKNTFQGRISCRMHDPEDPKAWLTLDTAFTYDNLGNIDGADDDAGTKLVFKLLDELREKGMTVKTMKPALGQKSPA